MEITTPNLDNNTRSTPEFRRNESQVKFEFRAPEVEQPRKPGFFSRLLKGLSGFAPLAYLAAPFTGGLSLIAGAALQGGGAIADKAQATHYAKENARLSQARQQVVTAPGFMSPGTFASDPTLATIASSRENAIGSAIQKM